MNNIQQKNNFIIRDGRIVIHRKKEYGKGFIKITRIKSENSSSELTEPAEKINAFLSTELEAPTKYEGKGKKKKGKKKRKHKKFRNKKAMKKMKNRVSENSSKRTDKNGNLMAEMLKKAYNIAIVEGLLWIYNSETGCYESSNPEDVSVKARTILNEEARMRISSQEYRETYNQLMISEELLSKEEFFANQPFVNCLNGVVDVMKETLLPHDVKYRFKHCIMANYDTEAKCPMFLEFVDIITDGDEELKKLLQTMLGYLLSHYNNAKTAFLMYGPSNTGKSVISSVLERVVGLPYVSHVDIDKLQEQEFAAELSGKILNVAPDLDNRVLKNVGFFKSLVSHNDTIAARRLYSNPINVKGETKMLFSTNHLLSFDSSLDIGDIEAVFNRFIYFPFQNKPFSDKNDNKSASKDIYDKEIDGIFTWAMKGLRRYLKEGEVFPYSKLSFETKEKNVINFCPEKSFFDGCIKNDENAFESTELVKKAYNEYCRKNGITSKGNIQTYIIEHKRIEKTKKRIDEHGNTVSYGNGKAVYIGIRLKEKYRPGESMKGNNTEET